jgi:hypothetical protein
MASILLTQAPVLASHTKVEPQLHPSRQIVVVFGVGKHDRARHHRMHGFTEAVIVADSASAITKTLPTAMLVNIALYAAVVSHAGSPCGASRSLRSAARPRPRHLAVPIPEADDVEFFALNVVLSQERQSARQKQARRREALRTPTNRSCVGMRSPRRCRSLSVAKTVTVRVQRLVFSIPDVDRDLCHVPRPAV